MPFSEKKLFFEAIFWAIFYRILTFLFPFRTWIKLIEKSKQLPDDKNLNVFIPIHKVFRATRRSSFYLPLKEKCLIEALVMKRMLRKYKISTSLSFGLAKNEKNNLVAHAWLTYEGEVISGKKKAIKFVEIKQW